MSTKLFSVNPYSAEPVYEQLKNQIRKSILWGTLKERDRLPTIKELASALSINPNTIARVFRELIMEGHLKSEPGIGTFVANIPEEKLNEEKVEHLQKMLKNYLLEGRIMGLSQNEIREIWETVFLSIKEEER